MKLIIDISKDRYDEIMSMDWKNCRLIFDEEIRAIHDGKVLEKEPCEDCIRRSDVGLTDFEIIMYNGDYREGLKILLEKIAAAPSLTPMQKWIPVSERLPEEDGQYLITVKYKHVNDSYEDVYAEHGEWHDGRWDMFCFGHCGEVEDIIAWMPLPQPYQSEIPTGAEGSEDKE